MIKHEVFLCIGGNLGDREDNLEETRFFIEMNMGKIIGLSSVYESAGWQMGEVPKFLNQVVRMETALGIDALLAEINELEDFYGKLKNTESYVSREMDVDILFYGALVVDTEKLQVPHHRMEQRRFVMAPLNELAPDFEHPISKKKVSQLFAECTDDSIVRIV
ncbi:MAG: 2-amino-4-hydroxy-6-hydroxymethyldihydropteridine diphosphokinase [Flavobacteriales bacterium]|nr:2-amino-4-hydroxy-6-hydroxymethyldihydropteridine diphosphokinase [Flavobacteriales bacterium]